MSTKPNIPSDTSTRVLAAIVFTDAVGFSAAMQKDEERALALFREDSNQMHAICVSHGGEVLKMTGDGLLMYFQSAVQAVNCALKIQKTQAEITKLKPNQDRLQHRVGIHLGDVIMAEGDVMGDGVNIAARLQSEAKTGGICISQTVYDVVKNKISLNATYMGVPDLKNISEEIHAYEISDESLDTKNTHRKGPAKKEKRPGRKKTNPLVYLVFGGSIAAVAAFAAVQLSDDGLKIDPKKIQEQQKKAREEAAQRERYAAMEAEKNAREKAERVAKERADEQRQKYEEEKRKAAALSQAEKAQLQKQAADAAAEAAAAAKAAAQAQAQAEAERMAREAEAERIRKEEQDRLAAIAAERERIRKQAEELAARKLAEAKAREADLIAKATNPIGVSVRRGADEPIPEGGWSKNVKKYEKVLNNSPDMRSLRSWVVASLSQYNRRKTLPIRYAMDGAWLDAEVWASPNGKIIVASPLSNDELEYPEIEPHNLANIMFALFEQKAKVGVTLNKTVLTGSREFGEAFALESFNEKMKALVLKHPTLLKRP